MRDTPPSKVEKLGGECNVPFFWDIRNIEVLFYIMLKLTLKRILKLLKGQFNVIKRAKGHGGIRRNARGKLKSHKGIGRKPKGSQRVLVCVFKGEIDSLLGMLD